MSKKADDIQKRIDELKARLNAERSKEALKERKARDHRLIVLGAMLEADGSPEAKKLLGDYLKKMSAPKPAPAATPAKPAGLFDKASNV